LLCATWGNHLDIVQFLIEQRPNINHQNLQGSTALIAAASSGFGEITQALLENDADQEIVDKKGETALSLSKNEHAKIYQLLRQWQ